MAERKLPINWTTIIVSGIGALSAVISLIVTLLIRSDVSEVHKTVNSRMDELLKASESVARTEGREEGRNRDTPREKGK